MKNKISIIVALGLALSLSACSSNYVLETSDGRTIIADGKPKVDEETGLISYTDAYGHHQQINRDALRSMTEAK
ncbi:YgdI/YgdR family lipoprotein [Dickeya dadantii]|uniref:Putative lipoprotein n=1 Tax=Dickeya dadantii (strain 3937) TaxID=198628 RepID=E0SCB5_DICD3|nr:YgdI/YgdR family lipoprotein [Dickeya dadantii]ADM97265.1 Putative lipoprotein [Dickeya dadantii 3937]MCL6404433.1 YgdI/YgdR family lipoprotein [Dickeya dadantii]NAT77030.1 YgdI/YgdR family lipoprotein [Dickeya dadantii]NPE51215.1 YgdI/YgdR family lipoprotein [Dickeya dadantii]NPE63674.1 YgdI/YgdR family lipoprotein [Dickeya dadantii]